MTTKNFGLHKEHQLKEVANLREKMHEAIAKLIVCQKKLAGSEVSSYTNPDDMYDYAMDFGTNSEEIGKHVTAIIESESHYLFPFEETMSDNNQQLAFNAEFAIRQSVMLARSKQEALDKAVDDAAQARREGWDEYVATIEDAIVAGALNEENWSLEINHCNGLMLEGSWTQNRPFLMELCPPLFLQGSAHEFERHGFMLEFGVDEKEVYITFRAHDYNQYKRAFEVMKDIHLDVDTEHTANIVENQIKSTDEKKLKLMTLSDLLIQHKK